MYLVPFSFDKYTTLSTFFFFPFKKFVGNYALKLLIYETLTNLTFILLEEPPPKRLDESVHTILRKRQNYRGGE